MAAALPGIDVSPFGSVVPPIAAATPTPAKPQTATAGMMAIIPLTRPRAERRRRCVTSVADAHDRSCLPVIKHVMSDVRSVSRHWRASQQCADFAAMLALM
jgi:hypothetical protein